MSPSWRRSRLLWASTDPTNGISTLNVFCCPSWSMTATSDHGAGESEVSHCASMAANFIGWSSRATWASVCPLTIENTVRSEEHTSELQLRQYLVCRLL